MKSKDEQIKLLKRKIKELKDRVSYHYIIVPDSSLNSIKVKLKSKWIPYWEYYPPSIREDNFLGSMQFEYHVVEE